LDELNTYEYGVLVEWYWQRKSKYSERSVLVSTYSEKSLRWKKMLEENRFQNILLWITVNFLYSNGN
jgi:hypothetical protein